LDGIGMQEHDALTYPTAADWIATYNKFYPICSEMAVTECDVNTSSNTNWPSAAISAKQANQYGQLFKCYVERSYRSGRGKIINVTKDGLNDAWTFVKYQSTSLWDTLDQCKPAFYAVARVGQYYNMLDSLLKVVDSLHQTNYTTTSWATLTSVAASAKNAMIQSYSVSSSADTTLGKSKDSLIAAMANLTVTGISNNSGNIVKTFSLSQNYPNPFNPTTNIAFSVPARSFVSLKIYNVLGQEIATLANEELSAGNYTRQWNAINIQSGVYFYRLQAGSYTATKKLVLLK
ncbi:MAG TPA: endo-1,4-beta-xylanase, partial [Bacteroidota bacterium]|nr:endo-1,4-beta-xylanase [Bacteroidota bacterium]